MKQSLYKDKHVLIVGLAKSGMSAARLLHRLGANIIVNNGASSEGSTEEKELKQLGIPLHSGGHPLSLLEEKIDIIVKNPGIRYDLPLFEKAGELNIPIITEMEIAGRLCEGTMIAITGSNGKTTTSSLLHALLEEGGKKSYLAGNIGTVACEVSEQVKQDEFMVTEVSSFQLKGSPAFQPNIGIILNIFDAHLDYHGSKEDYVASKGKMFANMTEEEYALYNADDPEVTALAKQSNARLFPFSTTEILSEGACIKDGWMMFQNEPVMEMSKASLPGRHNHENMLAAAAAAMLSGVDRQAVENVLTTFSGIKHRLQYVGDVNGIRVYNDSKATNILSTQKAIEAFSDPVVLIAGGLDRGNEFDSLEAAFAGLKAVVAYGETKYKLADTAEKAGLSIVKIVDTLEEATAAAGAVAEAGDVLLLSPACASWDQFKTFEQRGDLFIQEINKQKKQ